MVSDQLCHGNFFHYVNPKNKDGLTPLHMATINIQSLKYVNIVLQVHKIPKIKIAAIYGHFRYFQSFTTVFTKMTND